MQVLLTGSSGFTGSRLALYLAQSKAIERVVGVDRAAPRVFHPRLEAHTLDLTDWQSLRALAGRPFHAVVHAAADQSSPYLLPANTVAMKNLLDLCDGAGAERFVFFSSFYASMRCDNRYRYGKLDSEHELRRSGLHHVILRPDMIYGHGEAKMQTLIQAIRRRVVPVVGWGDYLRTPTYVWDLCRAVERMLVDDNFPGETYDVGSPTPYTMNTILQMMARELGVNRYLRVPVPPAALRLVFSVTQTADADQMRTVTADRVADPTAFVEAFGVDVIDFAKGVGYLCKGDDRWPI